jgi:hypothetical protein
MRFTIRDLLWLMVVALGVGWWIDRSDLDAELRSVSREVSALRHLVGLDEWPAVYGSPSPNLSSTTQNLPKK